MLKLLLLRVKTYLCSQNRLSNIVSAAGPEGEMTKEDISEPAEGDRVLGCYARNAPHQRAVIHQVASAPMPSDSGEDLTLHVIEGGNVEVLT